MSHLLTKLTTYQGLLPQGAKTSTYISNLVFWDKEPKLEYKFRKIGFVYTRFVDDIQVSSRRKISKYEKEFIIRNVYGMFFSNGFEPKRKKHNIETKRKRMSVHNRNINSGKPTLPQEEILKIRAAVKELEDLTTNEVSQEEFDRIYSKVFGRVNMLRQLQPLKANQYLKRLTDLRIKIMN